LDVNTCPEVPTPLTFCKAPVDVVPPAITAKGVKDDFPVPPLATTKVPVNVSVEPEPLNVKPVAAPVNVKLFPVNPPPESPVMVIELAAGAAQEGGDPVVAVNI